MTVPQIDFPPQQREPKHRPLGHASRVRGLHRPGRDHQQRVTAGGPPRARPRRRGPRVPHRRARGPRRHGRRRRRPRGRRLPAGPRAGHRAARAARASAPRRRVLAARRRGAPSRCRPPPGRPTLVVFLETGCGSCREEAAVLAELARGGAAGRGRRRLRRSARPRTAPASPREDLEGQVPLAAGRRPRSARRTARVVVPTIYAVRADGTIADAWAGRVARSASRRRWRTAGCLRPRD